MMKISDNLDRLREYAKSVGATELARRTGLPRTTIQDALKPGRYAKTARTLDRLFHEMETSDPIPVIPPTPQERGT